MKTTLYQAFLKSIFTQFLNYFKDTFFDLLDLFWIVIDVFKTYSDVWVKDVAFKTISTTVSTCLSTFCFPTRSSSYLLTFSPSPFAPCPSPPALCPMLYSLCPNPFQSAIQNFPSRISKKLN